jgi:phosphomannomutase
MTPNDDLPPTDGLRLWLEGDVRIIIRPSGTEAKVKCYVEVVTRQGALAAQKTLDQLRVPLTQFLLQS